MDRDANIYDGQAGTIVGLKKDSHLGRHVNIDLYGCDPERLNDTDYVRDSLVKATEVANCTVAGSYFHEFEPCGISGVVILAESHASYHGWAEYGFCAIDLFYCSNKVDEGAFIAHVKSQFSAQRVNTTYLDRGGLGEE